MVSPSNHRPYHYLTTILPLSSFDLKLELSRVKETARPSLSPVSLHCLVIRIQRTNVKPSAAHGPGVHGGVLHHIVGQVAWGRQSRDSTLYLRWSATKTLRSAKGFKPRNVVRRFSSARGISSSSFAMHSSAKELDTTLTPVKSSTTFS